MRTSNGFTLIELLVVILVLGILATLAAPVLLGAKVRAEVARAQADLATVNKALHSYYFDHGAAPSNPEAHLFIFSTFHYVQRMHMLTTPTAYLTTLPESPWHGKNLHVKNTLNKPLREQLQQRMGGKVIEDDWTIYPDYQYEGPRLHDDKASSRSKWLLSSYGPTGVGVSEVYDPSNGIISLGGVFHNQNRLLNPFVYQKRFE